MYTLKIAIIAIGGNVETHVKVFQPYWRPIAKNTRSASGSNAGEYP